MHLFSMLQRLDSFKVDLYIQLGDLNFTTHTKKHLSNRIVDSLDPVLFAILIMLNI